MRVQVQERQDYRWPTFLILLAHAFLWLLLFPTVEEDAFIYLRFADNIANGWGYVFNAGGERVESGTSLVWVVLLALFMKLPLSPILVMKLLGLLCSGLTILLAGRITYLLTESAGARLLTMATCAISYPLVYWATQGLETPLVAFLLMTSVFCMLDPGWRKWLWVSCAVLVIVRPEGPIYLIVLLWWGWLQRRRETRAPREMWLALLAAVSALVACTSWRLWYFGDFVVHPFYFKSSNLGAAGPWALLSEADHHLRLVLFLAPVIVAMLRRKLPSLAMVLVAPFILQMTWYAHLPDHFPFERHLVPALAPLFTLSIVSCWSLARGVPVVLKRLIWGAALALPVFTAIHNPKNPLIQFGDLFIRAPMTYLQSTGRQLADPDTPSPEWMDSYLQAQSNALVLGRNWEVGPGKFLAAVYPENSIIAYHEMGQTPYYAGRDKRFIDTAGLVTRRVGFYKFGTSFEKRPFARLLWDMRCTVLSVLHRDECPSLALDDTLNYILDQNPDVVMVQGIVAGFFGADMPPRALTQYERFQQHYRRRYVIDGHVQVYELSDRNFPVFEGSIPGVRIQRIP